MLAATWCILAWLMITHTKGYSASGVLVVPGVSPLRYAMSEPAVLLHYLRLAFWPVGLCLDYGWPVATRAIDIVPSALLIGALRNANGVGRLSLADLGVLGGLFF